MTNEELRQAWIEGARFALRDQGHAIDVYVMDALKRACPIPEFVPATA